MKKLTFSLMLALLISVTFFPFEVSASEEYHHLMWEDMYETSEIKYQLEEGYFRFGFRPLYLEDFKWSIDNFGDTHASLGVKYGMDEDLVVGGNIFSFTRRWYDNSSGDLVDTEQYFTGMLEGKYKILEEDKLSVSAIAGGRFSSSEYDESFMPSGKGIVDYELETNMYLTNSVGVKFSLSNNDLISTLENSLKYIIDESSTAKISSYMRLNNLDFSDRYHNFKAAYRHTINEEVDYIGYIQTNDLGSNDFFNSINNAVVFSPKSIPELELSSWFNLNPGKYNSLELAGGYKIDDNLNINSKLSQDITNNRTEILITTKYMF